jgi:hypothetical protein
VLFLHVVLFREGAERLGLARSLGVWPAAALILGVLLLLGWGAARWARADYRFGLEWLLRRAG